MLRVCYTFAPQSAGHPILWNSVPRSACYGPVTACSTQWTGVPPPGTRSTFPRVCAKRVVLPHAGSSHPLNCGEAPPVLKNPGKPGIWRLMAIFL